MKDPKKKELKRKKPTTDGRTDRKGREKAAEPAAKGTRTQVPTKQDKTWKNKGANCIHTKY